jgi:hypothetical protein
MRQFKPTPKNASANRIRERYLHQLGLQRGEGAPLISPHHMPSDNHVVVISGLPSLPEDRATTEHCMESHDFSISKHTQHSITTSGSAADENSCEDYDHDDRSDAGGSARKTAPTSASPNHLATTRAGSSLLHMALAYPTAVLKVPPPPPPVTKSAPPPSPLSRPMPWRNTLSQSACVLLDLAEYHRAMNNDHDSSSSVGTCTTCTTAESTAMISRDWGAFPHTAATSSAGVSISTSQGGESPASSSAPGVHFLQNGQTHSRPIVQVGGDASHRGGNVASTSSLVHELNRFNIDSDCDASVTSNNYNAIDDHRIAMDDDDASVDNDTVASRTSVASHVSAGSALSRGSAGPRTNVVVRMGSMKKKIGRTQRLMERAAAHERILRRRSDQSQRMRADVVHAQRGMVASEPTPRDLLSACQASIPLVYVNHGGIHQGQAFGDAGRTPTASNCSDLRSSLRRLREMESSTAFPPEGVHMSSTTEAKASPLWSHPRLASGIQIPPSSEMVSQNSSHYATSNPFPIPMPCLATSTSRGGEDQFSSSLQHANHQATADDVMEVAMALSSLSSGMRWSGSIPRIR